MLKIITVLDIEALKPCHCHLSSFKSAIYSSLTHLSLAFFLSDIGKQYSPRCDATERAVTSGAILFAKRVFIMNLYENLKSHPMSLQVKVDSPKPFKR